MPVTPLPGTAAKPAASGTASVALGGAGQDGGGQRVLAAALEGGGQPRGPRPRPRPGRPASARRGLPTVSVPVLSTTRVSTSRRRSIASAFLNRTPRWAPLPVATMIDIGVARPERARARDDEHGDRVDQGVGEARRRAGERPHRERDDRDADDDRHEPARRPDRRASGSGRGCAGPRRPSRRCATSRVSAPTRSARMTRRAGAVDRAADDAVAGVLLGRHRLAGDHRLVDRALALDDDAVDRDLLAGADPEPVADRDPRERDVLLDAVVADAAGGRRGQAEERADRGAGAAAGAQLEHLADQDQRDDRRRRLEVDGDLRRRRRAGRPGRCPGASAATRL